MLGHRKVPHDIHHFHKTRVSDPNSTLLEYLLYAAGVNPLVSEKKKICICACTNMCKIIREWNVCFNKRQQWFCHFGLFFLTQTHFDMQIFCKRINELVLFIIKALHCLMCHLTTRTRMCIHRGMQCVQCSPAQ